MNEIQNPHFAFPFRLKASGRSVAVVEQDSEEDITNCVEVLLRTERGSRIEVPDYGIDDPTFHQVSPNDKLTELQAAIVEWEPRAETTLESELSSWDSLKEFIRITVQGRQN